MSSNRFVPYHHVDREWDARFNVPTEEDLELLLLCVKEEYERGKYKYVLVSGIEVGTQPFRDDYLMRHVHCCFGYNNRVSKSAILKNLKIKQGNGYYLVPRNRSLPYKGWRDHHAKEDTKVDANETILYENGVLPQDKAVAEAQVTLRSAEEKKRKLDDIIMEMRGMIEEGKDEEAFKKFPRNYLTYGEKIKSLVVQTCSRLTETPMCGCGVFQVRINRLLWA
ncbi:hypothetical protein PINS_up016541 [Pythium insidiosum]|nr:hypothetical protein PINS_up016541 [Pythium insidiosum]